MTPERIAELARLADVAAAWRHVWAVEAKSLTTARQGQLAAKEVVLAVPDLLAEVERVTRQRDEALRERDLAIMVMIVLFGRWSQPTFTR
jgi:hypothetical protein